MVEFVFNGNEVKEADFSPIPDGWYTLQVKDSEMCFSNLNSNNQYLKFTFTVVEGEYANRQLIFNFNVINTNDKAVTIAKRQLLQLSKACGQISFTNTQALHGKIISAQVKVDGEYNKISKFNASDKVVGQSIPAQKPVIAFPPADDCVATVESNTGLPEKIDDPFGAVPQSDTKPFVEAEKQPWDDDEESVPPWKPKT